jgi:hypothetical protein
VGLVAVKKVEYALYVNDEDAPRKQLATGEFRRDQSPISERSERALALAASAAMTPRLLRASNVNAFVVENVRAAQVFVLM